MAKQARRKTTRSRTSQAKPKSAEAKAGVSKRSRAGGDEDRAEESKARQAQVPPTHVEGESEGTGSTPRGSDDDMEAIEEPRGTPLQQLMRTQSFRAKVIARVVEKLR